MPTKRKLAEDWIEAAEGMKRAISNWSNVEIVEGKHHQN
jgi:hypothetical protein